MFTGNYFEILAQNVEHWLLLLSARRVSSRVYSHAASDFSGINVHAGASSPTTAPNATEPVVTDHL
jgi:hypothetical protein